MRKRASKSHDWALLTVYFGRFCPATEQQNRQKISLPRVPYIADSREKMVVRTKIAGTFLQLSDSLKSVAKLDLSHLRILPNFITAEEESKILEETDKRLVRQKYQRDHWDDAIVGYRQRLWIMGDFSSCHPEVEQTEGCWIRFCGKPV